MSDVTISGDAITGGVRGLGGALDGASRMSRETARWAPSMGTPDMVINRAKPLADGRGRDMMRNEAYAQGAAATIKDSVVGAQYRLNARPNWRVLSTIGKGFDDVWADEFAQQVEARFNLIADSPSKWLDASRMNTLTGMIRLGIGVFFAAGEVLGTAEWIRETARPVNTAIQLISPDRLCNAQGMPDTRYLRRGITRDDRGRPLAYAFRKGQQFEPYPDDFAWTWVTVPAEKPWGRKQVIHIIEQQLPDQSRGLADIVAALKQMKMTKKFQEITLQNAVVNATYAAAIESELPAEAITAAMGAGSASDPAAGMMGAYGAYMSALTNFLSGAENIGIDGVMVPHLFPGTKLNLKTAGTPGGVGTDYEVSLLRHTASALGLSYEEFSNDFSRTNYSSGKLAIGKSGRFMASRKKHVADGLANDVYALVLEEEIAAGNVPLPRGVSRDVFYAPLGKEALTQCSWIGAGQGQVNELQETQAAMLRIKAGLSTHEMEIARLGNDYREVFAQLAREQKQQTDLGLNLTLDATQDNGNTQDTLSSDKASDASSSDKGASK